MRRIWLMILAVLAIAVPVAFGTTSHSTSALATGQSANMVGGTFRPSDMAVNMKTGKLVHFQKAVGSGNQWCYGQAQVNAWGGGPWVNSYDGCPGPSNGDFANITLTPTINHALQFRGGGAWNGRCIGDANNDPSDARTSLDSCGNNGIGEGWGVDLEVGTAGCPSGYAWFRVQHWSGSTNGYLGPVNGWVNGSHMYLNKQIALCFKWYPPA